MPDQYSENSYCPKCKAAVEPHPETVCSHCDAPLHNMLKSSDASDEATDGPDVRPTTNVYRLLFENILGLCRSRKSLLRSFYLETDHAANTRQEDTRPLAELRKSYREDVASSSTSPAKEIDLFIAYEERRFVLLSRWTHAWIAFWLLFLPLGLGLPIAIMVVNSNWLVNTLLITLFSAILFLPLAWCGLLLQAPMVGITIRILNRLLPARDVETCNAQELHDT